VNALLEALFMLSKRDMPKWLNKRIVNQLSLAPELHPTLEKNKKKNQEPLGSLSTE